MKHVLHDFLNPATPQHLAAIKGPPARWDSRTSPQHVKCPKLPRPKLLLDLPRHRHTRQYPTPTPQRHLRIKHNFGVSENTVGDLNIVPKS